MANRNAAKGTRFENLVLEGLLKFYPDAHRLGKQGAKDKGDFWLPGSVPMVIEAKAEASYAGKLSGWLAEAEVEAMHAGKPWGVVAHKRHGVGDPLRQYVTL